MNSAIQGSKMLRSGGHGTSSSVGEEEAMEKGQSLGRALKFFGDADQYEKNRVLLGEGETVCKD